MGKIKRFYHDEICALYDKMRGEEEPGALEEQPAQSLARIDALLTHRSLLDPLPHRMDKIIFMLNRLQQLEAREVKLRHHVDAIASHGLLHRGAKAIREMREMFP
jgi:DNA-directed RNA polymerase specialized sigma24 family protein